MAWDAITRKWLNDKIAGETQIICNDKGGWVRSGKPNILPNDDVRLALGLEGALKLAEGDDVPVSFRNIEIDS